MNEISDCKVLTTFKESNFKKILSTYTIKIELSAIG